MVRTLITASGCPGLWIGMYCQYYRALGCAGGDGGDHSAHCILSCFSA